MIKATANLFFSRHKFLDRHAAQVGKLYDKWADGMFRASWYRDERVFEYLDQISTFHPLPRRILEIGYGDGSVLSRLAKQMRATEFVGIDISHRMFVLAQKKCQRLNNVQLHEGNWLEPVVGKEPFDVIVVKNALHLLDGLEEKLEALASVSHGKTKLVIVETVSPSNRSRAFVQAMFRKIDHSRVKLNFFTRKSLSDTLRSTGWGKVHSAKLIDQELSVDSWLKFKLDSAVQRASLRRWILDSDANIRAEMKVSIEGGELTMLRRQTVLFLSQDVRQVLPFRR